MITIITTLIILYLIGLGYCINVAQEEADLFRGFAGKLVLILIFLFSPISILMLIGTFLYNQNKNL